MTIDIGTGASLTTTTSWSATILSIEVSDISRESIQISDLSTTGGHVFMPGDLVDPGSIELELLHDTDNVSSNKAPLTGSATMTWTVNFATTVTATTPAKVSGKGFITAHSWSIPLEDRVTSNVTIKFTGTLTWSDAT